MKYTKQLVSGRDIDLSKHNLGIIKQPTIDDFMGDFDVVEFMQPFFLERVWKAEGLLEDNAIAFTMFCLSILKAPDLEKFFMNALDILYRGMERKVVMVGDSTKVLFYDGNKPVAFIDDTNFDVLCETVVLMLYQNEPKKEKQEKIEGSAEDIALFEKFEKEFAEKQRKKNEICFEERVRQLLHIKNKLYEEIKHLTVWQFEDYFRTSIHMENYEKTFQFASSGNFKVKLDEIDTWQVKTKIKRD